MSEIYFKVAIVFFIMLFFLARAKFVSHYKWSFFRRSLKYIIIFIPLGFYLFGVFDFAILQINFFIRIFLGLFSIGLGLALFFRAHFFLGNNWSPVVEEKFSKSRSLVLSGPYRYIRHPIYLASFICVFGIFVFSANWFLFGIFLLSLIFFYNYKIPLEEKELVRNFGKRYEKYMREVGGIFPKFL